MQALSGTVGDGGANAVHDAALVQAILVKNRRPARAAAQRPAYLASYDGTCGPQTIAAIRQFQSDHALLNAAGTAAAPNVNATPGRVDAGDATWTAMVANVDAGFADLRVLTGGRIAYVQATQGRVNARLAALANLTFTTAFAAKMRNCINEMSRIHGIAVGVCRQGDRRTFQQQYDLFTSGRGVTNAGPGESNHNFGMAADMGFEGLRWLRSNGTVVENETCWLHRLDPAQNGSNAEANRFWGALRTVGTSAVVGAFRGPVGDRPHLQNWDDAGVVMAVRLADLLTRSGTMRWQGRRGAYSCDFGLGGPLCMQWAPQRKYGTGKPR